MDYIQDLVIDLKWNKDIGKPYFSGLIGIDFKKENFQTLTAHKKGKVAFIDGGNNEILVTPSLAIHMIRLYYSIFEDGKKVDYKKMDFLILAKVNMDNKCYEVEIKSKEDVFEKHYKIEKKNLLGEEIGISGIGGVIRRYGEWLVIEKLCKSLKHGDLIVRDGALQTSFQKEHEYAKNAINITQKKGVNIIGVSKTCSLLTTTGFPLSAAVHIFAEKCNIEGAWSYHPLIKEKGKGMYGLPAVVKYHPHSQYVLRTDVLKFSEDHLSLLAGYSSDPSLLGYPYGLIDADINARITDREKVLLKNMVENIIDEDMRKGIRSLDLHDRLSKLR